jgi:hypothetical protein
LPPKLIIVPLPFFSFHFTAPFRKVCIINPSHSRRSLQTHPLLGTPRLEIVQSVHETVSLQGSTPLSHSRGSLQVSPVSLSNECRTRTSLVRSARLSGIGHFC